MFARLLSKPVPSPIGCALSENALRLLQLDCTQSPLRVKAAVVEPLDLLTPDNQVAWRASLAAALKRALAQGGFEGRQAVLCLPSCQMGYRRLRLAAMPASELATAVQWRAAKELAQPINTFQSSYYDAGQSQDQGRRCQDVIAVTASSTDVELAVNTFAQAGLEVVAVDAAAGALARALASDVRNDARNEARSDSRSDQSCLVVEVGVRSSCVMVTRQDQPCFIRTIPGGRQQIVQRAASRLGLDAESPEQLWQLLDGKSGATAGVTIGTSADVGINTEKMLHTLNEVASLHAAELAHEVILCTHYMTGLGHNDAPTEQSSHSTVMPQQGCIVGAGVQENIFLDKVKDACDMTFASLGQMLGAPLGMALESIDPSGQLDSWLIAAGLSLYDIKQLAIKQPVRGISA